MQKQEKPAPEVFESPTKVMWAGACSISGRFDGTPGTRLGARGFRGEENLFFFPRIQHNHSLGPNFCTRQYHGVITTHSLTGINQNNATSRLRLLYSNSNNELGQDTTSTVTEVFLELGLE